MGTTIAVSMDTKEVLRQMGEKGETYDHIIQRLIDAAKIKKLDVRWNKILQEEEFTSLDDL